VELLVRLYRDGSLTARLPSMVIGAEVFFSEPLLTLSLPSLQPPIPRFQSNATANTAASGGGSGLGEEGLAQSLCLVAGGSGITPMLQLMEAALEADWTLVLFYSVSTLAEVCLFIYIYIFLIPTASMVI